MGLSDAGLALKPRPPPCFVYRKEDEMLGDALRLIRTFHEMTQAELAKELNVSNTYISEIERGNREPSLTIIQGYADFFGIPASSILFFSENLDDRGPRARANRFVSKKVLKMLELLAERQTKANAST